MSPAKRPGAASAVKKKSGARASAGAVLASTSTDDAIPEAVKKPAPSRSSGAAPAAAGGATKKVTVEVPDKWFQALRKRGFQFETTQKAIFLAMLEMLAEGVLDDEIRARTADGRLEGKRGPKGGLRN